MGESCEKCRYWQGWPGQKDLGETQEGHCRAHPPTNCYIYARHSFKYPTVPANQWCGEFTPKEGADND